MNTSSLLPLAIVALIAVTLLLMYFRSVKDQRGLEYIYKLFDKKLTRERFYEITRLIIQYTFWLAVIVIVLLVANSIIGVLTQAAIASRPTVQPSTPVVIQQTPAVSIVYVTSQPPAPSATPDPGLPFQPAGDNEILVVIVPFAGSGDILPEEWIEKQLAEETRILPASYDVRIERYPHAVPQHDSEQEIEQIKQTYRPTILVWGWYDQLGITANYAIAETGEFFSEYTPTLSQAFNLPSSPDSFVFYITRDLPEEIAHLTFFEMSQIFFSRGDFGSCITYLQKAIENLPAGRDAAQASLYFLQGLAYLKGYDDFETAIRYTELALEIDPDHYPSLGLRGNAYVLRLIQDYITQNKINITVSMEMYGSEPFVVVSSDQEILLESFASQEAFDSYNRVVELIPARPEAYYLRAMQHYAFGRKAEAIADLERVIAINSEGSFLRELAQNYIARWNSVGATATAVQQPSNP